MSIVCSRRKKTTKFNLIQFARLISKNSKTQVILVKNEIELGNYFKKNLISNEIIIGMGAGKYQNGCRNLNFHYEHNEIL